MTDWGGLVRTSADDCRAGPHRVQSSVPKMSRMTLRGPPNGDRSRPCHRLSGIRSFSLNAECQVDTLVSVFRVYIVQRHVMYSDLAIRVRVYIVQRHVTYCDLAIRVTGSSRGLAS